jgi:MarR family transcriptional regulator, temperature-dependent positive regulator of motility
MDSRATSKRSNGRPKPLRQPTRWEPDVDLRKLMLEAILKDNPIPTAYRVNYVANFYVGPLVKLMEETHKIARAEWIVLFCLHQQPGLNAQQISDVTGRAKTSISAAVKLLDRKKLIVRQTDAKDARRQVLQPTDAGRKVYKDILRTFVAREAQMIACLNSRERETFTILLDKIIDNGGSWARPY